MKLIATDYDGTLNYNGVSAETLEAIRIWRQNGNAFGVVSGRGPEFIPELKKTLGEEFDYLVLGNGSYATDSEGNVLFTTECSSVDVRAFVKDLLEWGAPIVFVNYENRYIRIVLAGQEGTYDYLLEDMPYIQSFYKVCTIYDDRNEVEPLARKVEEKYGEHMNVLRNGRCLDLAPFGVDKAQGIRGICDVFGVDKRHVIAVGDELNDVAMLKAFKSYAMRHGNPKLTEYVDGVVESVAEVIEKEM